ncbi:gfo/Idh/MocA family oxidoreductase [Candidatus Pacearchaeota archaeon]|nr:gfo/Idh/MocA family oxidoreductase [Candidatus Pacearchaeota archaeon]MBD3282684.1 gfo/Idh/MocA family oxidoreductase [Candidatus Pacearchaeota archaeon]
MKKIKFGLIGCGRVSKKHLDSIKLIDDAELKAVCDIVEERARDVSEKMGCEYYTDYKELLKDDEIEVVNVCTPPSEHEEMVVNCAKSKKHIICEKPMSLRLLEAKNMIEACRHNNIRLFIVKQNRYNLPIKKLKEAINNERFGDLFFLNATVRWSRDQNYYDRDPWRKLKNGGCGVLMNQTSHHLDMLYYLGGEIESVNCYKKTFAHDVEVEDGAVAVIKFKNGALGTFEGSTCAFPKDIEGSISILGRKGSVKIGGFAMNKVDFWMFDDRGKEDEEMNYLITNPPNVYGFGHFDLIREVINCLKNEKDSELDGDKVIESLKLIIAMQRSAKENREVFLSEFNEEDGEYYT